MLFSIAAQSGSMNSSKVMAASAALTSGFVISDHLPVWIAIIAGMAAGTLGAWSLERQSGNNLPKQWLVWQMAAWGLIAMIAWALNENPGLSIRWTGCVAALMTFASRAGLKALHARAVKRMGGENDGKTS